MLEPTPESLPSNDGPVDACTSIVDRVVAAIRDGRPEEKVVAVATTTPGVTFLRVYAGDVVVHAMLVLDEGAASLLPESVRPGIALAERFTDRGQVWLVVPLDRVPEAQKTLRDRGHEPRVGGYALDAHGVLQMRWW